MFIEALGDAGVKHGLPRAMAYRLAGQMVAGTGRMQVETGAHPGAMKDAVCSPAARPLWAWRSWSAAVCARL
jgi:pyrroline-5-carboxylate reductase